MASPQGIPKSSDQSLAKNTLPQEFPGAVSEGARIIFTVLYLFWQASGKIRVQLTEFIKA